MKRFSARRNTKCKGCMVRKRLGVAGDSKEPRVAGARAIRMGWEEVGWHGRAGHTRSCGPWWKPWEGIEVAARTSGLDFRKGCLAPGWRLDWKERGREWKQGDQLGEDCNHPEMTWLGYGTSCDWSPATLRALVGITASVHRTLSGFQMVRVL